MRGLHPVRSLRCAFLSLRWLLFLVLAVCVDAQWDPLNPVTRVQQQAGGALFQMQSGVMRVQVGTDSIIHVLRAQARRGSPTGSHSIPVSRSPLLFKDNTRGMQCHDFGARL